MSKLYVTNLTGEEFPLLATSTNDLDLNGNQSISLKITSNKVNDLFIDNLTEMWTVTDHEDVEHKIIYAKKKGEGDRLYVDVKAIPLFFDKFDTLRIYEEYNQHMTANQAFTLIFKDTGFNFVLVDSFLAVEWEGFGGGESRLETFKRALERYKAEFRISGNTIYLESQIGRDTSHMYRYKLNASNIVQEIDASAMWTYAKGYGNYGDGEGGEDWKDAKLIRDYTSPLAAIIGIRHAPPIQNGNIKIASFMDEQLKTLVDESLKISVSADLHDLTKQGYPIAQSELGDRVFLIDERIELNEEVRVVDKSITRDWRGNILDLNIVFGSEGIVKRHQSELKTAIDRITELIEGKTKLPFSVLDNAVIAATKALQSAQTELEFNNGIIAREKTNPNKLVLYNSAGLGISVDGGHSFKTAITADGIVADVITAGTLRGIIIEGVEIYGSTFISETSPTNYTKIEGAFLESRGRFTRTWKGSTKTHDIRLKMENGYLRARNDSENQSIYFSDFGISTFADGSGEDSSSGTIEFFTYEYSAYRGLTIHSHRGIVALKSEENSIVFEADGLVEVRGSNLRADAIGVREPNTNFYVGVSGERNGELRVTDKLFAASPIRYMPIRASEFRRPDGKTAYINETGSGSFLADNVSVLRSGGVRTIETHFYVGVNATDGGELRVTNSNGYNEGGTISYRPVRAREFITDTSIRENKRNIDVYDEDVLDIIRNGNAYLYNRANEMTHTKKQLGLMLDEMPYETYSERGDGFGIYGLVGFLFRGLKQTIEEIDKLKGVS